MNLGASIKRRRKEAGLDQAELSQRCGLSQTAISQIETNKAKPSEKTLEKICRALGTTEAYLYLTSMEESDVPEANKDFYRKVESALETLIEMIFNYPKD